MILHYKHKKIYHKIPHFFETENLKKSKKKNNRIDRLKFIRKKNSLIKII